MLTSLYNSFDFTRIGIVAVNDHGDILFCNNAMKDIFKLHRQPPDKVWDFLPETVGRHVRQGISKPYESILNIGNHLFLAQATRVVQNEMPEHTLILFQDYTIIKNTICNLDYFNDNITELRAILDSSYDGFFITDGNGTVLLINKAYERLTGVTSADVVGKNMHQLVSERMYDKSVTLIVLEQKKHVTINQVVRGERHMLVTGSPVFDNEGHIHRVITNVRDITELNDLRRQLEETQEISLKYEKEISHLRSQHIVADGIIYRSKSMGQALFTANQVAQVDSTVLITGESGTGKELVARFIHQQGKGTMHSFIAINCAALPEELLEAELFGYEGGSFTGSRREGKIGLIELANNGTLFMDEIGDMPIVIQAKLLRVIQEKKIRRVGGTNYINVTPRIICATHQNLQKMVETNLFRRDLYYRLMVVPIHVPQLSQRKEDIPLLVKYFTDNFNAKFNFNKRLHPDTVNAFVQYDWPGNVRELENLVEHLFVIAENDEILISHLPRYMAQGSCSVKSGSRIAEAVAEIEYQLLKESFAKHKNWQEVAQELGIDRATAYRKAIRYGLKK